MALSNKQNKIRQVEKPKEESKCVKPWPHLPNYLLNQISKQPLLMQNINFGGISKSLRRGTPKLCNSRNYSNKISPYYWVALSDSHLQNSGAHHVFELQFPEELRWYWKWKRIPYVPPSGFYAGYSYGMLFVFRAEGRNGHSCQIWHPVDRRHAGLPPWNFNIPSTCALLSSSFYSKSQVAIVFTGISQPAFLFTNLGLFQESYSWIKQDCTIVDPNAPTPSHEKSAYYLQFTSAIEFKGKVYALSLYGTLAVIEFADSYPSITSLGKSMAFPSLPFKHFREYLLQSEEEILLVLILSKKSIHIVDDVEIFRLDCDRLLWDTMHTLGDKTVFVGANCGMLVSAVEARSRRNCVYFHQSSDDKWWIFDMESHEVSLQLKINK